MLLKNLFNVSRIIDENYFSVKLTGCVYFENFVMTVAVSVARTPKGKDVYGFRSASTADACKNNIAHSKDNESHVFKTSRNFKVTAFDANRYLFNVSDESAYEDLEMVNVEAKLPKDFNKEQGN